MFSSMGNKGNISTPIGVFLTPDKYTKYLRITQAAKSASISSIVQTGNASTFFSHSFGLWILDSGASDHFSDNKDIFSSLNLTSPLPTVTLANGSQTIDKGKSST